MVRVTLRSELWSGSMMQCWELTNGVSARALKSEVEPSQQYDSLLQPELDLDLAIHKIKS